MSASFLLAVITGGIAGLVCYGIGFYFGLKAGLMMGDQP